MNIQMPTTDTDATIRSAAALMARCNGLWRDEHDRNSGWAIDYAIDVDVITLFMAPAENSGYASVFPSDKSDGTQDLLGRMLGEFILQKLCGANVGKDENGSLLIISPHDEELERMTLALAAKVIKQTDNAKEIIENIVNQFVENPTNDRHKFLTQVVEEARDLIEAFDGRSGPRRELNRLGSLPAKRLRNLSRFEPYNAPSNTSEARSVLPPRGDVFNVDRDEFVALIGDWRVRLKKYKTRHKPDYALFGDAIVMATLQWINRHLEKQKRRLILITGSKYLFDSAGEVTTGKGSTFASDFLRHPLGFVADKDFFSVSGAENDGKDLSFRLSDWLNLFFPAVLKKNPGYGITVDSRILKSISEGTNKDLNKTVSVLARNESRSQGVSVFPKDMLDQWATVIGSTATLKGFINPQSDWSKRVSQFVDVVNDRLNQGWTIEQFQDELDGMAKESLSNLYWSTSRFGVLSDSKVTVRGLPALRFDSPYAKAQNISEKLIKGVFQNSTELDVEQLYGDLREMDPSNYHAHVIHALAYAGKGHWFATKTLCIMALNVVEELDENERYFRNGREAAYLLAVTERRLARDESDVRKKAMPILHLARTRENERLEETPEDVRFRSEEFAQASLIVQFSFFSDAGLTSINIGKFLIEVEEIVADAVSRWKIDKLGSVKNWIVRQTVTNGLILSILAEYQTPGSVSASSEIEIVRRLIDIVFFNKLGPDSDIKSRKEKIFCDALSDFVCRVAISLFDASARKRKNARDEVLNTSSLGSSQLPFESQRLKLFKSVVARST